MALYALPLGDAGGWQNPCGGQRWRFSPDGLIELEGAGVPEYGPGHARFDVCKNTWKHFRCEMGDAALRYDVPIPWILALACVETGPWSGSRIQQAEMVSYAGAIGVMQIMPQTAEGLGYRPEEMFNPSKNIDAGAKLIRRLDERVEGGLPAICGPYNSGQLCCDTGSCRPGCQNALRICTHSDYPGAAIRYNNTALRYLSLAPCSRWGTIVGFSLIAVGVAGALKWADQHYR